MRYSVEITRDMNALANCINKVNNQVDMEDWRISINAGGIDYGIYFHFDIENKILEICNQPRYDELFYLEDIIYKINEVYGEDEE